MNSPGEPLTPMQEAMAGLREMYKSLVESGFTEDQALTFMAKYLVELNRDG